MIDSATINSGISTVALASWIAKYNDIEQQEDNDIVSEDASAYSYDSESEPTIQIK
jgi:hypothetical protein